MDKSLEKFFANSDLDISDAIDLVTKGLEGADFGEFYQEITSSEKIVKDKGKYSVISVGNSSEGFAIRYGQGIRVGHSYSDAFTRDSLINSIDEVRKIKIDKDTVDIKENFARSEVQLYHEENPMVEMSLEEKIKAIDEIEQYTLGLDKNIDNVTVAYSSNVKDVHIITKDGKSLTETRPLSSIFISVTYKYDSNRVEVGSDLVGGRVSCKDVFNKNKYRNAAKNALNIAKELSVAEEAPSGIMDVVLAAGWPSVILHEAVGHGLEGDFNRKDISVYSGKIGQQVASPLVTIIDQGDFVGARGSTHFDDEGHSTQKNILVEKGVLKGYMQDSQNSQLMGVEPTGNGRRESYKHLPMVRMTNTYIENGESTPEAIIASVKDGLYVKDMSGGQVDITSGKFNMNAILSYRIRDGKLCEPIKSASIIGDGLQVIQSIEMVGNDMSINNSRGVCGKSGQSMVVGNGQPTILVRNLTIGGSN